MEPFDAGACGAAATACTMRAACRRAARLTWRAVLRRLCCAGRGALHCRAGGVIIAAADGLRVPTRPQLRCVICMAAICASRSRIGTVTKLHSLRLSEPHATLLRHTGWEHFTKRFTSK